MAKFRKKPLVITAEQYTGSGPDPAGVFRRPEFRRPEDNTPYVVTIHDQRCYLSPGDWVVPEPDGVHYYPIKPDIFAATYEPAGPDIHPVGRTANGPAYHVGIRCDEGETPGVLALSVLAKHAMIAFGAPRKSPLMPGVVPDIHRGFSIIGTETIKQVIAILQESLREIEQAQASDDRG